MLWPCRLGAVYRRSGDHIAAVFISQVVQPAGKYKQSYVRQRLHRLHYSCPSHYSRCSLDQKHQLISAFEICFGRAYFCAVMLCLGERRHLPKAAVAYPLSVKIFAMDGVL